MTLSSFNLQVRQGQLQLRFSDGHGRDLEGRAIMPVVAFASDLFAEVARRQRGQLHGLSVDLSRGVLRATVDASTGIEVVQIVGSDFETLVRPSSGPLIEWAEHSFEEPRD